MAQLLISNTSQQLNSLLELVCEQLQLTDTQHEDASISYGGIGDWLSSEDSPLAVYRPEIFAQGSKALLTTVKPRRREEFDIDIICLLHRDHWLASPVNVYNDVLNRISAHATYRSMLKPEARCITLTYEKQYRLEIVPAVPSPQHGGTSLLIPDRARREWVRSDPEGYIRWFAGKAQPLSERRALAASVEPLPANVSSMEKTPLHRAVQLFKRRRDVHFNGGDAAPRSIVLTTIDAEMYAYEMTLLDAVNGILGRLVQQARQDSIPPRVPCPTDPTENLAEAWRTDPRLYIKFIEYVNEFQDGMNRLAAERSMDRIAVILNELFDPADSGVVNRAVKAYTDRYAKARAAGDIRMTRSTSSLTTAATTAAASFAIPKNTFYGD